MSELKREDMMPEEEEVLDPRIVKELETLNEAAGLVNEIEPNLGAALKSLQSFLTESAMKLEMHAKKHPRSIKKTRIYFELVQESKRLENGIHKAAGHFENASCMYKMAKEAVHTAEQRKINQAGKNMRFDVAWQEFMNQALLKYGNSEVEKRKAEEEHQRLTILYTTVKEKMKKMEKDNPRKIKCARPYFELKERVDAALLQASQTIADLREAHEDAKERYKLALKNLERISMEIHLKRSK